jgi:uncharacterized protein YihD (DUF1040 family)
MVDHSTNQSNSCSKRSESLLERRLPIETFLRDLSREVEFDHRFNEYTENCVSYQLGGDFESKLKVWNDLFRFMPNDADGIMSHINSWMA